MKRKVTEVIEFSYDLVVPISRRGEEADTPDKEWNIIEKGSEKAVKIMGKYVMYISADRIRAALADIRQYIFKTPLSETLLLRTEDFHIYVKRELDQITHSVQARGVIYTLLKLSDKQKHKGVIAISTGDFAYTLCYFGKEFGIPVTVVMPKSTTDEKVNKCRELSASVIVCGDDMVDLHKFALHIAMTRGLFYLDRNDHPNMIIGQATLGTEISDQNREFDVVILPTTIDGCGLTASIAMTIKRWNSDIKIIEDELNIPVERHVAYVNDKGIQNYLFDWIITVPESSVQIAADFLDKVNISDYYGAIGLAGIQSGFLDFLLKKKRVLIPLFGRMDSSFTSNEPSLSCAGPSTSSF